MIERELLETQVCEEQTRNIVYARLVECFQIPSVRDKILHLCDTLKILTKASSVFLVDYEAKQFFAFFDTKSYQKHLHFFSYWISTLRKQKKVFLSKGVKTNLSDYIFLRRNNLENILVLPIMYEESLIGVVTLENTKINMDQTERDVDMLLMMMYEQFEKLFNLNLKTNHTTLVSSRKLITTVRVLMDKHLTLIEAMPEFYELLQTTKVDFYKTTRGKLIELFDLMDVSSILAFKDEKKEHYSIQKIRLPGGEKVYIFVCLTLTGTSMKKCEVAKLICKNITETKSACDVVVAENLLRKSVVTIDQPGHLLLKVTDQVKPVYISKNARKILNVNERNGLEETNLLELIYESDVANLMEAINKSQVSATPVEINFRLKKSDKWLNCCISKLSGLKEVILYATLIDISDMKILVQEAKTYKKMPGFVAKLAVTNRLKLIEASEGFFEFLGLDMAKCNKFIFPPVFKKDVRLVNTNIEKMKTGKPISFDFRVKNKVGKVCWFHLEANCIGIMDVYPVYLALFIDITKQRHLELDLEEKRARYELIDDDDKESFFEYDIINDVYHGPLYGRYEGVEELEYGIVEQYIEKFLKNHENMDSGLRRWINLLCGIDNGPFVLTYHYMRANQKRVAQIHIDAAVIYDDNMPVKVVGKLIDKNKHYDRKDSRQIDAITNLYSRSYGEKLIKEYVQNNLVQNHLLLIDIDDFKVINAAYGYMFGNVILNEFAELLTQLAPKKSILYRIKEDDFVMFLKESSVEQAKSIANQICERIKNIYMGEDDSIKLTCSIGISGLKYNGDFETSLHQAELIVNQVKNSKDGLSAAYAHYGEKYNFRENDQYALQKDIPKSYLKHEKDVLFFAYEILEKTKNIRNGVNILLDRTGKQMNLKSIVILQSHVLEDKFAFSYWWHHQTSYSHILSLLEEYKPEILTCCKSIIGDITSIVCHNQSEPRADILVCSTNTIKEELLIVEALDSKQSWTSEEKELILELSKIILMHLKKSRVYSLSQEKSKFLSKMSHEIRTPLNIIIGMANMTKNVKNDEKRVEQYLKNIDLSAKYLLNLVNNLLEMNRIESGKISLCNDVFDLRSYLEDLRNIMEIQASSKNINYQCTMKVKHDKLIGDTVRLNQVLINLLGNAIKFTPEYGFVSLDVTEVDSEENKAFITFTVKDSGIGISEEKLGLIFVPFEQECKEISRKYGGTGLGLSISNSIVNMMGGTINVKSKVNVGSEFYFTIPLEIYQGEELTLENKPVNVNLRGKHILVAEDNPMNAEIVKTLLKEAGATVEVTHDGLEVIEAFTSNAPKHFDAILMDVSMPIMDGLEATMEIRKIDRSDAQTIPIVAMTANAFPEDIRECIDAGMNGHLSKPFDLEKMYAEMNRALKNKQK